MPEVPPEPPVGEPAVPDVPPEDASGPPSPWPPPVPPAMPPEPPVEVEPPLFPPGGVEPSLPEQPSSTRPTRASRSRCIVEILPPRALRRGNYQITARVKVGKP